MAEIANLSVVHQVALRWFENRAGQELSWPKPLDNLFLLNKAKGIHKPAGWEHALSVRQGLDGPYADREVIDLGKGIWTYDYHQEGAEPSARDQDFTNRALMRNLRDGVPVGVVKQIKRKPAPLYRVLGLATVEGWEAGYFRLRSYRSGSERSVSPDPLAPPLSLKDARIRIEKAIVVRQGSGAFREAILGAFGGRCAISDYDVEEGLEAAHIVPYRGVHTNEITNGLLLRADLHTLFDRGLLTIDPISLRVQIADKLLDSSVGAINGQALRLPEQPHRWRDALSLRQKLI